jgi:hypothetical protein
VTVLKSKKTLAQEYAEFAAGVIPKDAPQVQQVEMRRAFYAGASSMFYLMTGQLDKDKEPTDDDVLYVESLSKEIEQFARNLSDGRA